jgi:hypothetical protein
MPRRSFSSTLVPDVDGQPPRLEPPPSLSAAERNVFNDLVAACDKKHLRGSDAPLLSSYCRAIVFEQQAAKRLEQNPLDTKALALWEKATRAIVSLSMRLRLSPQSRQTARATGRQQPRGPRPWE